MKIFHVPAGTPVTLYKGMMHETRESVVRVTRADAEFTVEQMVIDPLGHHTFDPNVADAFGATIAAEWGGTIYEILAQRGRYGFFVHGWTVVVQAAGVEVW